MIWRTWSAFASSSEPMTRDARGYVHPSPRPLTATFVTFPLASHQAYPWLQPLPPLSTAPMCCCLSSPFTLQLIFVHFLWIYESKVTMSSVVHGMPELCNALQGPAMITSLVEYCNMPDILECLSLCNDQRKIQNDFEHCMDCGAFWSLQTWATIFTFSWWSYTFW